MTYSAATTLQRETHAVGRTGTAMCDPRDANDNSPGWQAAKARFIRTDDYTVTLDPGAPQPNQPPPADAGAGALASR